MKTKHQIIIIASLFCFLFINLPTFLSAQRAHLTPIISVKKPNDRSITMTYSLYQRDVDDLFEFYKLFKKEDCEVDMAVYETIYNALLFYFEKEPKEADKMLRYVRLAIPLLKIADSKVSKTNVSSRTSQDALQFINRFLEHVDENNARASLKAAAKATEQNQNK